MATDILSKLIDILRPRTGETLDDKFDALEQARAVIPEDGQLLTSQEAAELMGISEGALRVARNRGTGPEFSKDGRNRVWYQAEDIIKYMEG